MFIAYLLHPIVEQLHEQYMPRWLAISLIYLLFFGGVGYAIFKMYPIFLKQWKDLLSNVPQFVDTYRKWINDIYESTSYLPEAIHDRMDTLLYNVEKLGDGLVASIGDHVLSMVDWLLLVAVIPVLVFYMLKDYPLMKQAIWQWTPHAFREEGKQMVEDIDKSLGGYIRGQLLVCLFVGVISILALWLIGMKYSLVLGALMGITNVIPYFGPIIGAIPAIIIAVTVNTNMIFFVLLIVFMVQLIESNLLAPYIVGKSLHIHPLLIILALLIGGELAGILGLVIAVPTLTILRVIFHHIRLWRYSD